MDARSADRRTWAGESCAVCGVADARLLASTRLEDGMRVTVCGSHKIAHRKSERLARTIDELRAIIGERRAS